MFNWINYFELEKYSFLLGFISASLLWLILIVLKRILPNMRVFLQNTLKLFHNDQSSTITLAIKKDAFYRAQKNHIAGQLCPLNDLLIEPYLLVPPIQNIENDDTAFESEIASLIPFTPDFPFLSRNYSVPKIKIIDAIRNNADIVITGLPGMGKSVALAHLASQLATDAPACGNMLGKTPFYFHVNDSDVLEKNEQSIFDVIYKSLSKNLPVSIIPRLSKFIRKEFDASNVVLIIDGCDELTKDDFDKFTDFLEEFIKNYEDIPVVLTASNLYVGRLINLGFISLAITPISNQDHFDLTSKWTNLWYDRIFSTDSNLPFQVKEKLFFNWSIFNFRLITPLEFTLLIWGGLSGDLRGESTLSIYESLFARIFGPDYDPEKLSEYAHLYLENNSSSIVQSNKYSDITAKLSSFGIIKENYSGKLSFNHPDLLGFLASMAPANTSFEATLENMTANPSLFAYFSFLSARDIQSDWLENLISIEKPPLFQNIFMISSWLRHTPQKCSWRTSLLKKLLQLVQNNQLPFGIRLRSLGSIMFANDSSTTSLVKQLLSQKNPTLIHLTLLAIGCRSGDELLLGDLLSLFQSSDLKTQKYTALVLAQIINQNALHALAKTLLDGEESLRQFIAEILASLKGEGVAIIKDAITMEDILVRRSAIFGLIRINENWAIELLQKLSFEDNQWVIRNIALQALEYLQGENHYLPQKRKPAHENEWLIKFASLNNLGVSPQTSITPLIIESLKNKDPIINSNGINLINSLEDIDLVDELYRIIYSENQDLSNKALETCWKILIQGMDVPTPSRFGIL